VHLEVHMEMMLRCTIGDSTEDHLEVHLETVDLDWPGAGFRRYSVIRLNHGMKTGQESRVNSVPCLCQDRISLWPAKIGDHGLIKLIE